jgi:hypothetical protein
VSAEIKKVKGKWYHQTKSDYAKSILSDGFIIESGGNQRFTEGVYFSNHSESSYGEATLECEVEGDFIDMGYANHVDRWMKVKQEYKWNNYTDLTKQIQDDYPDADGIILNGVLVVWKPKKISKCRIIRE